jgi:hypothetical protein
MKSSPKKGFVSVCWCVVLFSACLYICISKVMFVCFCVRVCVLFALFLLTRFFILFYVRRVGFEPRTYYLPTCNPTLPQAFDCSLKIFRLSTICCREDVSAISNCRIRSSCCIRCAKSSSCCHFSRVTCCRSPSTR